MFDMVGQLLRQVDELESIGDSCYHLARTLRSKRENSKENFTPEQYEHTREMMTLTDTSHSNMDNLLEPAHRPTDNLLLA